MKHLLLSLLVISLSATIFSQSMNNHWSTQTRKLRYRPDGDDFVIVNGEKKFNRALYGTNTAFRVEAGDLPEFAFYMPGFGGNFQIGIVSDGKGEWMTNADSIETRYRAGSMIYTIKDSLLGDGKIVVTALALADREGGVFKVENYSPAKNLKLVCVFGGATGKKFKRDGDLNTDPESIFYLKPENCKGNRFITQKGRFNLWYGSGKQLTLEEYFSDTVPTKGIKKLICGLVSSPIALTIGDAKQLGDLNALINSKESEQPVLVGTCDITNNKSYYISIFAPVNKESLKFGNKQLPKWFQKAEEVRDRIASRIKVVTPDPFINNLGATLGIAADAIWEYPTYLHGAIGWRMRLNGWRGPYTADPLGWHDRAKAHFSSYAESQVTSPESGPSVPDEKRNWARQEEKMGNALFTSGYICRNPNGKIQPHHYDMNLVFIDALLRHLRWTGDLEYAKEMWPVLERHLNWEKRNFDGDNDGLYDAYCCIWASDALEYGGGGVAHSSAYNYLGNKMAAEIAELIGKDPARYKNEADKIFKAIKSNLWLDNKGWFAEFKDWNGEKRTHDASALWTIYHVLDSEVADPFQRWQSTKYIDTELPRLPVKGEGLNDDGYFVHSTTNWQPYDWSINNVVMAENLHTALAYWQSGRIDEGYNLWKSTLLDAMYLGGSPGNFVQLSFLDAARGEMYRDFADEVGMTARSLVEGLFGIRPDALKGKVTIQPGLPSHWNHAVLSVPDVKMSFVRTGNEEVYEITPSFKKVLSLTLKIPALLDRIETVTLNGQSVQWQNDADAVQNPTIIIECGKQPKYTIKIVWKGERCEPLKQTMNVVDGDRLNVGFVIGTPVEVYDPQGIIADETLSTKDFRAVVNGHKGHRTCFVKLSQGDLTWWQPININIVDPIQIVANVTQKPGSISFKVINNKTADIKGYLFINNEPKVYNQPITIKGGGQTGFIVRRDSNIVTGSNLVLFEYGDDKAYGKVINWDITLKNKAANLEVVSIDSVLNDKVTQIFKNSYETPRWSYPTLQLPRHGIGNWCYNNIHPDIDDSGLRALAGENETIELEQGIVFRTSGSADSNNVSYTSLWDNYNDSIVIPITGWGKHLYLLMTGSTNPMQSQIANGVIVVEYTDGTTDELELTNPENWWPIEQDYFHDGFAFNRQTPTPPRIHLKTGLITRNFNGYTSIQGFSNRIIEGGAATVVDMPINPFKKLKRLTVKTLSNEVVIGLMGVTILRD